jgi:hypothetical protein
VAGVLLLEGEVEGVVVVAVVFVPLLWFAIQRFASNGLHLTVQAADLSFGHHTMVGPEGGREGGERGERGQERREGGGANLALESCLFRSLILFSKLRREIGSEVPRVGGPYFSLTLWIFLFSLLSQI